MYQNMKKYLLLTAIALGIISVLTCLGAGVTSSNGNIDWSVFELIYGSLQNPGTATAWYFLLAGMAVAIVAMILSFLKKSEKMISVLSLADSTLFLVSGILFGAVQAFSDKSIGVGSVMICIMVCCAACLTLASGLDILLFYSSEQTNKKYRKY